MSRAFKTALVLPKRSIVFSEIDLRKKLLRLELRQLYDGTDRQYTARKLCA